MLFRSLLEAGGSPGGWGLSWRLGALLDAGGSPEGWGKGISARPWPIKCLKGLGRNEYSVRSPGSWREPGFDLRWRCSVVTWGQSWGVRWGWGAWRGLFMCSRHTHTYIYIYIYPDTPSNSIHTCFVSGLRRSHTHTEFLHTST